MKALIVIGVVALAAGVVGANVNWKRQTEGEKCLALLKPQLKDPESATVVKELPNGMREWIVVEYRARNSLGGMEPGWVRCTAKGSAVSAPRTFTSELAAISTLN